MRILVDGAAFGNDHQRGIQRYFRELLSRLGKEHEITMSLLGDARAELPGNVHLFQIQDSNFPARWNIPRRAWRFARRRWQHARLHDFDLVHATQYDLAPHPSMPLVITIHDMITERFANAFSEHWRTFCGHENRSKKLALAAAARVIAISDATSKSLAKAYPEVIDRTRIVYHGADHLAIEAATPANTEPYVLFVGDRTNYKNFGLLARSIESSDWPSNLRVRVCGKPWDFDETIPPRKFVEHLGRVSDIELAKLYRNAHCFVFPSLEEGFGFPLLEAQSYGTPVACSDIPVFHEAAAGAAIYFDPTSPQSLIQAILACGDPVRRIELREKGIRNFRRFTWDACAIATAKVYEEACHASTYRGGGH